MAIRIKTGIITYSALYAIAITVFFQGCMKMSDAPPGSTLNKADTVFERKAAYTDLNISAIADVAAAAALDTLILGYARRAGASHRKAYGALEAFAGWHTLLPKLPDSLHLSVINQLCTLSGRAFDSVYLFSNKAILFDAITHYNDELRDGNLQIVKEHASGFLPIIQSSLTKIDSIIQAYNFN